MADKDQIRKIQFTGKSSYIVSLPKDWITDQGLKQGDQVSVGRNGSNTLEVKPVNFSKSSVPNTLLTVIILSFIFNFLYYIACRMSFYS